MKDLKKELFKCRSSEDILNIAKKVKNDPEKASFVLDVLVEYNRSKYNKDCYDMGLCVRAITARHKTKTAAEKHAIWVSMNMMLMERA